MKIQVYSSEVRAEAVKLVLEPGLSQEAAAKRLSISQALLPVPGSNADGSVPLMCRSAPMSYQLETPALTARLRNSTGDSPVARLKKRLKYAASLKPSR